MSEWNKPSVKLWSNWSLRSSLFIRYHLRRWRISPKFYPYTNKMREWNDEDCLGKSKMFSSLLVWIFYGIFEILQLEFEDRLSPLISETCFLDAAVLIDVWKSVDKTERKKLKDFFNKVVDKWKVSSNDSHMGIITFGSNESLIFVLHKKISQCWRLKQKGGGHHISWLNQTWNLHRPFRRSGRESNIYQLMGRQTQSTLGEISHIYMYKKTNKWTNWFVVGEQ